MVDSRDQGERHEPRFGDHDPARPPEFAAMPPPTEELGPLGLEFESVMPPKMRRRGGLRLFLVFVGLMIGGGAAGWYLLGDRFTSAESEGDVPIVRADINPAKVRPADPGGMEVPNRDKTIYEQLSPGESKEGKIERLLPPPEEPKAPEPVAQPEPRPAASTPPPPPPAAPDPNAPLPRSPRALKPEPVTPQSPVPSAHEVEVARKPTEPAIAAKPGSLQPPPPSAPVSRVETVGMQTQPAPAPTPAPAPVAPTPAPEPQPAPVPEAKPVPAPVATPAAAAPAKGAYRIQIGALRTRAEAEAEWKKQQKAHPDLLGGLALTIVEVNVAGKGTFFRIRGGGLPSEDAAKDLCGKLTAKKVACLVVKPGS